MNDTTMGRRKALGLTSAFLAGCSAASTRSELSAPPGEVIVGRVWEPPYRRPPGYELVNPLEFEEQARHQLEESVFSRIAGGNRDPFNFMTFRPRMGISTVDMDLSVPLFGESLFTPMIVGPISDQGLYHEDGELATTRGAAAARTVSIASARSSVPLREIAGQTAGPLWYGVYADGAGRGQAEEAVAAGARALFITVGATYHAPGASPRPTPSRPIDWGRLESIREGLPIPVAVKGILTPEDANTAVERGFDAIVVSDHAADGTGVPAPIDALSPIATAVAGRIPVLVDGSFRRGTDVLKALILGADAVLIGRPVVWGLAAYGADGVQWVLEKMQEELARGFAMIGVANPSGLTRDHIRIHTAATA